MKKFKNLLKVVSRGGTKSQKGESADTGELSENVTTGLKRVFRYLENQSVLPRGLYKEPGFVEEISAIENLINSGKISETYLAAVRSTHSIANSIVNVLSTHDPVIPKDLYDHFMSPLADLDALMDDLAKKEPLFEVVMQHLRYVVGNATVKISCGEIAATVGIYILRAAEDDSGIDSHSFEMQSRVKTFEKMLQCYIRGKEDAERFFASANTTNRRSTSLAVPLALPSQSNNNRFSTDSTEFDNGWGHAKPFVTTPPAPGGSAHSSPQKSPLNTGTIQERSVKITFANPNAKPSQDELETKLSRYGTVNNVGFKEKLAVALFSTRQEAQACVRDHDEHGTLGDAVKVKYLGGALDPLPSPQTSPAKPATNSLALQPGEEVTIRHFSNMPGTDGANGTSEGKPIDETIKVSSPPRPPPRDAANKSILNTSGISAIENTSGWANASRSSPPKGDKSFTLNLSHVSEFGEADTSLNHNMSRHNEKTAQLPNHANVAAGHRVDQSYEASRRESLDTSVVSLDGAPVNITRSALNTSHNAQGKSRNTNEGTNNPNQSLRVQDLSMVSFAPDVEEHDHHEVPSEYSPSGKITTTRATPSKARRYVSDSTDSGTADSGGSSPESGEGQKKNKYPSAPGSAGATLWPTRTISPPKPQPRGPKLDDIARGDSLTVSPTSSWKSAQSTKSPELPKPQKKNTKNVHYDTEEESSSDSSGKIMTPNKSSKVNRSSASEGVADSKASTVMRVFTPHTDPRERSRSRSSSSEDVRHSSQLTSVTVEGSSKFNRFSTESLPLNSQVNNSNNYQGNLNARSQDTPRSTTSGHSMSEQSATSSVKKRQIRTIHVGSPHNSAENAQNQFHSHAQVEDKENYLQEEQSERMLRTRSGSEDLALRDEKPQEVVLVQEKPSARNESVDISFKAKAQQRETKEKPFNHSSRVDGPVTDSYQDVDNSLLHKKHFDANAIDHHGQMQSQRAASVPASVVSNSNPKKSADMESNPEMIRLVQSLQERLLLLEAQVNLSAESESLRKVSQVRAEEQWTAQIIALNIHNQKTFSENAHLQEELQRLKIEMANTQAELGAAEATKRSLLLNCEGLKDRAQHEALDTVISQKRLIASLEQTLAETRRQSKKLEEELGYMKDKHCSTASSLITWKAKALELSARQMGSTAGSVSFNQPPLVEADARTAAAFGGGDSPSRAHSGSPLDFEAALERSLRLDHSGSAEHKSTEPDTHDKIRFSHTPRNELVRSNDQSMPRDEPFRLEGDQEQELQNGDFSLDAQRRAADRITRQYISKLPVPEKVSASLEAQGSPFRGSSLPQHPFVPNPLYAHLIPAGSFATTAEAPSMQIRPVVPQNKSINREHASSSPPRSEEFADHSFGEQPSRPELTEGDRKEPVMPERGSFLAPVADRASSPHTLRSASASRSTRTRQSPIVSRTHNSVRNHQLGHKEPTLTMRPTEGNERFALLMSKRSRSPELPSGRFISPMLPLQHVPLAAEMLEYETRLQNLSRASAASRAAPSRGVRNSANEMNIYSTLARSYNSESFSGFSSKSLGGDRLGSTLSRSYAPSNTGNPFAMSMGSNKERSVNTLGRSMESGLYRSNAQSERRGGVSAAPPLWAQYKYT